MKRRTLAACAGLLCLLTAGVASLTACGNTESDPTNIASETVSENTVSTEEISSSESDPSKDTLSINGVYTDPKKSYQITLPDNWIEDSEHTTNNRVLFLSPSGTRSVEIVRQKSDSNLLAYSEAEFKKAYAAVYDKFKLQEYKRFRNDIYAGIRLRFTCKQNGKTYAVTQYVIPGEYDYNITWTALDNDDAFYQTTRDSVLTFRELNPEYDTIELVGRMYDRTYTDMDNRYTFTLPENWKVSSQQANQVLFISADKTANINIQVTEIDEQLYRYKKSYFTSYFQKAFGKSATITTFKSVKVGGIPARYLECTYTHNTQKLTSCQFLINSDSYTYSITYTAPTAGLNTTNFTTAVKTFTLK